MGSLAVQVSQRIPMLEVAEAARVVQERTQLPQQQLVMAATLARTLSEQVLLLIMLEVAVEEFGQAAEVAQVVEVPQQAQPVMLRQ